MKYRICHSALVSTTTRRTVIPDLVFFGPHRGPRGARTDHIDHRMTVGNAQLYGSESRNHVHHADHQAPQYHARRIGVRSRRERSLDRGVPVIHVPIKDTPPTHRPLDVVFDCVVEFIGRALDNDRNHRALVVCYTCAMKLGYIDISDRYTAQSIVMVCYPLGFQLVLWAHSLEQEKRWRASFEMMDIEESSLFEDRR